MPSSEAAPAPVARASPITSGPLHLENPRVVGISPTKTATLKTPQASSAAAWWSRVMTVQIGPRHAVDPVTMVEPDRPKDLHWNQREKSPPQPARDGYALAAPELTALNEVGQNSAGHLWC